MSDEHQNSFDCFSAVGLAGILIITCSPPTWSTDGAIISGSDIAVPVPIYHAVQASAKPLVHRAPFLPNAAPVTPVVRQPHAVPLVIHLHASVPRVRHVARGDGVSRGNGVCGRRGNVSLSPRSYVSIHARGVLMGTYP